VKAEFGPGRTGVLHYFLSLMPMIWGTSFPLIFSFNFFGLDFLSFGLDGQVMEGVSAMNYESATPVQQLVIPEILRGKDVIACAQTGTGKTAAFLLPILHRILSGEQGDFIKALIIVPTRELAIQIAQQCEGFGYFTGVSSLAVYGGGTGPDYSNEQRALSSGVDIVVCTPGRMISHLNMGYVRVQKLQFLVLDEADRMLDMGFFDDIMRIISFLPQQRQSLLFSATMPAKIRELTRKILRSPEEINIALAKPPEKIVQQAFVVYENQKLPMVKHLVKDPSLKSIVIFCDTKVMVKELSRELKKHGQGVGEIHSDLEQAEREAIMNKFKSRQVRVLVATDIISRGIDVEDIDMIINYHVPQDAEDYVHRIGRTARAEADGRACTLVGPMEQGRLASIERLLEKEVPKPPLPEGFGDAPAYSPKDRPREDFQKRGGRGFRGRTGKPAGSRPTRKRKY
jgi:ATP-dependent RNA helicase RhlE